MSLLVIILAERIKALISRSLLLARSLICARELLPINLKRVNGISYRGFLLGDLSHIIAFIDKYNKGVGFKGRWLLYRFYGCKLIIVAFADGAGSTKLVGVNLYYFNARDLAESTVHEGFIGVAPAYRGRGIASEMRSFAINHFSHSALKGISTRISLHNEPSVKSALYLGFYPVYIYWDESVGCDRGYFIKWFRQPLP